MTTEPPTEPAQPFGDLGPSPLLEADAKSLDGLLSERLQLIFNTMPSQLHLTGADNDLDIVVNYYRSKRRVFMDEENKRLSEGPKPKRTGSVPKSVAEVLDPTKIDFESI